MASTKEKLDAYEKIDKLQKYQSISFCLFIACMLTAFTGAFFFGGSPKNYVSSFGWFVLTNKLAWFTTASLLLGLFAVVFGLLLQVRVAFLSKIKFPPSNGSL